jgi:hypothetical protein
MTDPELEAAVAELCRAGFEARFGKEGAQQFVVVAGLQIPKPPWDQPGATIAVAVPAAFPPAALERFYLAAPCTKGGSRHPNCGEPVQLLGMQWYPAGWHYPDGRPWRWGIDTLESHIRHCHAFFFNRVGREHR